MSFFNRLKVFVGDIGDFLSPIASILTSTEGIMLIVFSIDAVKRVRSYELDSADDKRKAAYTLIMDTLSKRGISFSDNVIHACIEIALLKVKAS